MKTLKKYFSMLLVLGMIVCSVVSFPLSVAATTEDNDITCVEIESIKNNTRTCANDGERV